MQFFGSRPTLPHNGFGLGEVGDFNHKTSNEAPNSNLVKSVIRSTEPPILLNPC